jgi:hypothetical protein
MGPCYSKLRCSLYSLILVAFATLSAAQNQPSSASATSQGSSSQNSQSQSSSSQSSPQSSSDSGSSLAAAAKSAKDQRASHAKKVFTDEDMEVADGPLPRLKTDGLDNTDEVIAAITKYKAMHSPEQTEEAVHMWFDRYDQILGAAIQENQDTAALRSTNMSNASALCQESQGNQDIQDYQKCASRQMAEQRGAMNDQHVYMKNNLLVVRIQQSFMKIRNALQMSNMRYAWFKIRTANNMYM